MAKTTSKKKVIQTKTTKKKTSSKVKSKKTIKVASKKMPLKAKSSQKKSLSLQHQKSSIKKVVPTKVPSKAEDIGLLQNIGSDLEMVSFKNLILNEKPVDIIYSSDNKAVVCKVLSENQNWTIDIKRPIEKCIWTDKTGTSIAPFTDLIKQVQKLQQMEPKSEICIAIVLMRGSVENEEVAQKYLQKNHIYVVKYNGGCDQNSDDLHYLLKQQFNSFSTGSKKLFHTTNGTGAITSSLINKFTPKANLSALATLGPIGFFPKGSGTLGALVALPIACLCSQLYMPLLWIVTVIFLLLGLVSIKQYTQDKKEKDPGCVIIDEVVGQLITFWIVLPEFMHWPLLLLGFGLFRFFDIFKFGPVAYWDRRKTPTGVMMDDVMAGVISAFILAMLQVAMIDYLGT